MAHSNRIDAAVVVFRAAGGTVVAIKAAVTVGLVIRTSCGQSEGTKVVVEGMVLLHDNDDVVYFVQISVAMTQFTLGDDEALSGHLLESCGLPPLNSGTPKAPLWKYWVNSRWN